MWDSKSKATDGPFAGSQLCWGGKCVVVGGHGTSQGGCGGSRGSIAISHKGWMPAWRHWGAARSTLSLPPLNPHPYLGKA